MANKDDIKWPYGFSGITGNWARERGPYRIPIQDIPRTARGLIEDLQQMDEGERRQLLTWLRQMIDVYGYDSITAQERGIDSKEIFPR